MVMVPNIDFVSKIYLIRGHSCNMVSHMIIDFSTVVSSFESLEKGSKVTTPPWPNSQQLQTCLYALSMV